MTVMPMDRVRVRVRRVRVRVRVRVRRGLVLDGHAQHARRLDGTHAHTGFRLVALLTRLDG